MLEEKDYLTDFRPPIGNVDRAEGEVPSDGLLELRVRLTECLCSRGQRGNSLQVAFLLPNVKHFIVNTCRILYHKVIV